MDPQLQQLLEIWFSNDERTLSSDELRVLSARLREDSRFRKEFVSELAILGKLKAVQSPEPRWLKLRDHLGKLSEAETDTKEFEQAVMEQFQRIADTNSKESGGKSSRGSKKKWILGSALLGAFLIAIAWGANVVTNRDEGRPRQASSLEQADRQVQEFPLNSDRDVAILSRQADATWSNGKFFNEGDGLKPSSMRLTEGLAQIDFFGGAHIVLSGPAEFEILSSREISLTSGRAVAYVSELGNGFRFSTPEGEISAPGVTFAISAIQGKPSEVHVLEGSISISNQFVEAGNAVEFIDNRVKEIAFAPDSFPRPDEFAQRVKERSIERLEVWKEAAAQISTDPNVLLHYTMEGQNQMGPGVINHAQTTAPGRATTGTILGTSWGTGRWAGKSALHFTHEEDRILTSVPGAYSEFTFLIWARIDALTQLHTALILTENPARWSLSGSIPPSALESAIQRRENSPAKILRWMARRDSFNTKLNIAFQRPGSKELIWHEYKNANDSIHSRHWGNWACYAVTYDGPQKQMTHYINGKATQTSVLKRTDALLLDYMEIGNLSTWENEEKIGIQYRFYGSMDEIIVAKKAWSPAKIAEIFEAGKP